VIEELIFNLHKILAKIRKNDIAKLSQWSLISLICMMFVIDLVYNLF